MRRETGREADARPHRASGSPRPSRCRPICSRSWPASSRSRRATRNGRELRMFHRETDAAKVARNRDAIFDLHAAALEWLEDYTGIPYPFGKFDFVLIPSFQFGGMEHAGAILYNAAEPDARRDRRRRTSCSTAPASSRTRPSHMWFGDLVTMRWFNDVWMKEVFANFMAAKIVNPSFPQVNHELRFLLVALSGRVRGRPHGGHESDPAAARQPRTRPASSTARSSTRRRRSSCGSSR